MQYYSNAFQCSRRHQILPTKAITLLCTLGKYYHGSGAKKREFSLFSYFCCCGWFWVLFLRALFFLRLNYIFQSAVPEYVPLNDFS